MQIYAKQVPPEYQESPLMLFGKWPEDLVLIGNRDCRAHTIPEYGTLSECLADMAADLDEAHYYYTPTGGRGFIKHRKSRAEITLSELLRDYGISRNDGSPWTTRQRHVWREILESDEPNSMDNIRCGLELMTGRKWKLGHLTGCCQSDWQEIIFCVDTWTHDALEMFAMEYFNAEYDVV